jgi:hypothetical protein
VFGASSFSLGVALGAAPLPALGGGGAAAALLGPFPLAGGQVDAAWAAARLAPATASDGATLAWTPQRAAAAALQWAGAAPATAGGRASPLFAEEPALAGGLDLLAASTGVAPDAAPAGSTGANATGARPLFAAPAPPDGPQLLTARATVHGGLLLTADLWLLRRDAAGGDAAPVQRGVPVAGGRWLIPEGVGDSRPGRGGARSAYAAGAAHPFISAGLSGLLLQVVGAAWELAGTPTAAAAAAANASGVALAGHTLRFSANGTALLVPPGALRGGYVYAANATLSLRAQLAGPPGAGFALPAGVDGGWTAPLPAPSLLPASVYVHLPPRSQGVALTLAPPNGSALSTPFSLAVAAPADALAADAAARNASGGWDAEAAAAALLAALPSIPSAAAATLARAAADRGDAAAAAALAAAAAALAAAAANLSDASQCAGLSGALGEPLLAPAWALALLSQASAAAPLAPARAAAAACAALEAAAAGFAGALSGPQGAPPLVPPANASALLWGFRVVPDGGNGSAALAAVGGALDATSPAAASADAAAAAQAAAAAAGRGAWRGVALSPLGPPAADGVLMPLPGNGSGAGGVAWVLAYGVDAEGAVVAAGAPLPLSGLPELATAAAAAAFVADAVAGLSENATAANPAGALALLGSLSAVLAASGGGGGGGGDNATAPGEGADDAALRANNTALREVMLATVSTAVDLLGATAASDAVAAAVSAPAASAEGDVRSLWLAVARDDNGVVVPGTSTFNVEDFDPSEVLTLAQTTAIPLNDATAQSAIATTAALMGASAERSSDSTASALSALSSVLLFSLPTNVILGLAGGAEDARAAAGADASGGGGSGVAPFPRSSGEVALKVVAAAMEHAGAVVTGEAAPALRDSTSASLTMLSAALLRAAAPGDPPVNVSAGPPAAFGANASYCSTGALAMSTQRVDGGRRGGRAPVVALNPPIAPCNGGGAAAAAGAGVALPDPSIAIPLSVLFGRGNASARDVTIVQSSAGAFPTANISAGLAASAAAFAAGARPPTPRPDASGVYASLADAFAGTLAPLRAPVDLLPTRGADSRVISVTVTGANGVAVAVRSADAMSLVVPPASASEPSAALGAAAAAATRLVVAAVCPISGAPGANGGRAEAAVCSGCREGAVLALWGRGVAVPAAANRSATLAALGNATGGGGARVNITAQLLPPVRYVGAGGRVVTDAAQWRLEIDCGPFRRNFTCGLNGTGGQVAALVCPPLVAAPTCGWWNESSGAWSSAGCVATAHPATGAVVCACDHLTEFAARFASLAGSLEDEFEITLALGDPTFLLRYTYVIYLVAAVLGVMAACLAAAAVLDARGDEKFYDALRADEEVDFLRRIEVARGGEFILDRHLDLARAAPPARGAGGALGALTGELYALGEEASRALAGLRSGGGAASAAAAEPAAAPRSGALARVVGELTEARCAPANPYTTALYFQLALRLESIRVSVSRLSKADIAAAGISEELEREVLLGHGAGGAAAGASSSAQQSPGGAAAGASSTAQQSPGSARPAPLLLDVDSLALTAPNSAAALALARCATLVEGVREKLLLLDTSSKSPRALPAPGGAPQTAGLEDATSWERCVRLWGFFMRIWLLRMYLSHPKFSVLTLYMPDSPRTHRVLLLSAILLCNLVVTAALYNFSNAAGSGPALPVITLPETVVLALLSTAAQVPIDALLGACVGRGSAAAFKRRFPFIALELARRQREEAGHARLSGAELREELDAEGGSGAGGVLARMAAGGVGGGGGGDTAAAVAGTGLLSLAMGGDVGVGLGVPSSATGGQGDGDGTRARTPAQPSAGAADAVRDDAEDAEVASSRALAPLPGAAAPTSKEMESSPVPHPALSLRSPEDPSKGASPSPNTPAAPPAGFQFGWVDAPPEVAARCPLLLRACGRHPAQKAAFLVAARQELEKVRAAAASEGAQAAGGRRWCARETPAAQLAREDAAEAAAWAAARADALRVAALRKAASNPFGGRGAAAARIRIALRLPNCSIATAAYLLPVLGFLAFCVFYLILFGVYQGRDVVVRFVSAWLIVRFRRDPLASAEARGN